MFRENVLNDFTDRQCAQCSATQVTINRFKQMKNFLFRISLSVLPANVLGVVILKEIMRSRKNSSFRTIKRNIFV